MKVGGWDNTGGFKIKTGGIMKVETAFEETIALWTAMAISGNSKSEEIACNPDFNYMKYYENNCSLCEYEKRRYKDSSFYDDCNDCDGKCLVNWKTDINPNVIAPEFQQHKLYTWFFLVKGGSVYHAGCENKQSPYLFWRFFTYFISPEFEQEDSFDKAIREQMNQSARVQMRYWAEQVAVLVTAQYEKWKEKNNAN